MHATPFLPPTMRSIRNSDHEQPNSSSAEMGSGIDTSKSFAEAQILRHRDSFGGKHRAGNAGVKPTVRAIVLKIHKILPLIGTAPILQQTTPHFSLFGLQTNMTFAMESSRLQTRKVGASCKHSMFGKAIVHFYAVRIRLPTERRSRARSKSMTC